MEKLNEDAGSSGNRSADSAQLQFMRPKVVYTSKGSLRVQWKAYASKENFTRPIRVYAY